MGGGAHGAEILNRHRFQEISFKDTFLNYKILFLEDTFF